MKNTLLLSILSVAALALSACDCASCTTKTDVGSTAAAAVQASPVVITPASTSREFAFSVKGMHCGNCANNLTKAINNCDGVLTVNVSFADSRAVVNLRNADDLDCALAAAHGLNYVTGTPEAIAAASDTATP